MARTHEKVRYSPAGKDRKYTPATAAPRGSGGGGRGGGPRRPWGDEGHGAADQPRRQGAQAPGLAGPRDPERLIERDRSGSRESQCEGRGGEDQRVFVAAVVGEE